MGIFKIKKKKKIEKLNFWCENFVDSRLFQSWQNYKEEEK